MADYSIGDRYMNHAGGGMHGTGRLVTNRTNDDKATHDINRPAKHVSHSQPWVDSMDDESLRYYLHRETRRVNELHHALEVAEDFLNALEAVAESRGLDIFG
jgi:hypothetical protein